MHGTEMLKHSLTFSDGHFVASRAAMDSRCAESGMVQSAVFGDADKLLGLQLAEFGMGPTGERLETCDPAGREVDDRLDR